MKLLITSIVVAFLFHQTTDGLVLPDGNKWPSSTTCNETPGVNVDRRVAFTRVATAITTGVISGGSFLASTPNVAMAAAVPQGAEAFVGTFTDPINHPGGKRTIKLLDGQKKGDYQMAEVLGGGGRGEPENYVLPAVILGDRTIVIDFSPKGGPRDFVGMLNFENDIKFLRDGNIWPRQ